MAYIGEPQREIVVEPIQLPEPLRSEPEPEPHQEPDFDLPEKPVEEPVKV